MLSSQLTLAEWWVKRVYVIVNESTLLFSVLYFYALVVMLIVLLFVTTALGPMAKSVSSSPVILQQQKFLPQALPTRYQHLISSSSGTVIAAQIIHQSNPQPSLPASVTAAAASSKASVTVTIAGSSGLSGEHCQNSSNRHLFKKFTSLTVRVDSVGKKLNQTVFCFNFLMCLLLFWNLDFEN